jgi:hypothetical protein
LQFKEILKYHSLVVTISSNNLQTIMNDSSASPSPSSSDEEVDDKTKTDIAGLKDVGDELNEQKKRHRREKQRLAKEKRRKRNLAVCEKEKEQNQVHMSQKREADPAYRQKEQQQQKHYKEVKRSTDEVFHQKEQQQQKHYKEVKRSTDEVFHQKEQQQQKNYKELKRSTDDVFREKEQQQQRNYKNEKRIQPEDVPDLYLDQKHPPTANQLRNPECHAVTALALYYHRSGHEFQRPAQQYAELRPEVHEWLGKQADVGIEKLREKLQKMIAADHDGK